MTQLAPIGLTVYSRLEHLKKTIIALKNNLLAKQSVLYIFSDAAKPGDETIVKNVRKYLRTIDGFKKVNIIERLENSRLKNNREGQNYLLKKYGKMIWMAEDIVTANGFLMFMNQGLEIFKSREDILSICSYTPYFRRHSKDIDIYLMSRLNAWGYAIWEDRYNKINKILKKDYLELINDKQKIEHIKKYSGTDLLEWFKAEVNNSIDGIDTKGTFLEVKNSYYSVYPRKSLSLNIGHDGSGLHSGITDKYNVELWNNKENFIMPVNINDDKDILKQVASFYSSREKNISQYVILQILEKIKKLNLTNLSVWGTGDLAEKIFEELSGANIEVNFFLDSWPTKKQIFLSKEVTTPKQAILNGETAIVIASIANRYKMLEEIKKYNNKVRAVYYESE